VEIEANAGQTISVDVVKSLVRGNGDGGIYVQSYNGGVAVASISDSVVSDNQGSGISAYSLDGSETRVAVDRNTLVGNLYSGLQSTNVGTLVLANGNVSMRNGLGLGRAGGGDMRSLGNNLVEANDIDTQWAPPTIVQGK
jgi:hypothetical protein